MRILVMVCKSFRCNPHTLSSSFQWLKQDLQIPKRKQNHKVVEAWVPESQCRGEYLKRPEKNRIDQGTALKSTGCSQRLLGEFAAFLRKPGPFVIHPPMVSVMALSAGSSGSPKLLPGQSLLQELTVQLKCIGPKHGK